MIKRKWPKAVAALGFHSSITPVAAEVRACFTLCHGKYCGLRKCQASAWAGVATFLIKRKWPKIDQGGPWTPLRRQAVQGGCGLARHWFRGRFQASALPLVKLWAVLRSEGHPAGGVGPACRSIRGRIRASTGPLVGLALPAPLGQGGGAGAVAAEAFAPRSGAKAARPPSLSGQHIKEKRARNESRWGYSFSLLLSRRNLIPGWGRFISSC